ncbi:MAG: hypothetical protein QM743_03150 [Chitinophagaceae bacterium]|uniref:Limiting CO2-inducible protein B/C beta carbonyic anhydrase domain-containing protein n=1 Tax=Rurimicrobium arvi TaxID=2049916 RepID=A0ABP8MI93_9BACT
MLKKERLAIIRQYYPNALTTIDTVNRVIDLMEDDLDLEPSKVMLADSICSDDVNSIQYPVRFQEFLGPFKMGGLDGFPFTGLSGMAAFASHVPDDGGVFIYYGPHIGISKTGEIGEIHRFGQNETSGCCGAAQGALHKLTHKLIEPGKVTELDHQMNTIEQILYNASERILSAKEPLAEATEVIYEAIDRRIHELIAATPFKCHYIIVMGAILINSDRDMGSFSSAKRFEMINLENNTTTDLLSMFQ